MAYAKRDSDSNQTMQQAMKPAADFNR